MGLWQAVLSISPTVLGVPRSHFWPDEAPFIRANVVYKSSFDCSTEHSLHCYSFP
jgi:hypothetical protein